jgi:hypothetical protein
MLLAAGRQFLEMLHRRELPAPDETVSSYEALTKALKIEPEEVVTLADEAAAYQFAWWMMAKEQRKGGEAIENSAKRFFAARAGNAAVIDIPGVGRIERKTVNVKAEGQPRPARTDLRWTLKEDKS